MGEGTDRQQLYESFYQAHYPLVRDYVASRFGPVDAEDVAQETLLRAFDHLDQVTDGRAAMPWLRTVACRIAIDARRRRRPEAMDHDELVGLAPMVPDQSAEVAARVDLGGLLQRALRRLTARDRQALLLREVHGFAVGDIATLTGATTNTVRQRLFRARQNLGRHYQELGGGTYGPVPAAPVGALRALPRPARRIAEAVQTRLPATSGRVAGGTAMAVAAVVLATTTPSVPTTPPREPGRAAPAAGLPRPAPAPNAVAARLLGVPALVRAGAGSAAAVVDDAVGSISVPFTEQWADGLLGWTVTGRSATRSCEPGIATLCAAKLAPQDTVTVARGSAVPLDVSTVLRFSVRTTGAVRLATVLSLAGTVVTVTLAAGESGAQVTVASSATADTRTIPFLPSGTPGLWVRLDPPTRTVTVAQAGLRGPLAWTQLPVGAPLTALTGLAFRADRAGPAPGAVFLGTVDVHRSAACYDGLDNDADGSPDLGDQDCESMLDADEEAPPQCRDGIDNDHDGAVDYPQDASCAWSGAPSEVTGCSNGVDDDGDGAADYPDDPKCGSAYDPAELAGCRNGIDDDHDGRIDFPDDLGCASPDDDTEIGCVVATTPHVRASGLCVDPISVVGTFALAREGDTRYARGFVEDYRFAVAGQPPGTVRCVRFGGSTTANPCAALGGTFVTRVATLVDAVADPAVAPAAAGTVDVCTANVTVVYHGTSQSLTGADRHREVALTLC